MTGENIFRKAWKEIADIPVARKKEIVRGYLFIAPFLVLMILFIIIVYINAVAVSLTDAEKLFRGKFVGLGNYQKVLNDPEFWQSVLLTLKFTLTCVLTQIPAAFLLAGWINGVPFKKVRAFLHVAFLIPCLLNPVVLSQLFFRLFGGNPSIVNWAIGLLHLPNNFHWMYDKNLFFPLLVIAAFWQSVGFLSVFFFANFQTIDPVLYEAAKIDGASSLRILRKITLPLLRPAFTFTMVISVVGSLVTFDLVYLLFAKRNINNLTTMVNYVFIKSFSGNLELGVASAAGWVCFFIILAIILCLIFFLGLGKVNED